MAPHRSRAAFHAGLYFIAQRSDPMRRCPAKIAALDCVVFVRWFKLCGKVAAAADLRIL